MGGADSTNSKEKETFGRVKLFGGQRKEQTDKERRLLLLQLTMDLKDKLGVLLYSLLSTNPMKRPWLHQTALYLFMLLSFYPRVSG